MGSVLLGSDWEFWRSTAASPLIVAQLSSTEVVARVFEFPRFDQIFGKPLEALGCRAIERGNAQQISLGARVVRLKYV